MNKTCKNCNQGFEITDDDLKFLEKVSPVFNSKKYEITPPTFCPQCRQQRRLAICNEQFLYQGECGMCKKRTLAEYPPHLNKPIYCRECWHSDKWDSADYGKEVDFTRPIFDQILELKMTIPSLALNAQGTCINSDYIHYAGSCKNCYLIMHADFCEDCYYGYGFKKDIFCVDGFYNLHCELCYECIDCHKCYGLKYSQDCMNCHSSAFLRDCVGCKNCFACVGLREKEYCFENKQLTREEYEKKMKEIDLGSHKQCQEFKKRRKEIEKDHFFKEYQGHNLQDSLGDHLINCKEAKFCFDCEDVESAKYCFQLVLGAKNVQDVYQYGSNLQESYECSICGENSYHLLFCDNCHMSSADLLYCWYMEASKNCFACVGMSHKNYCILNKQYTKEQYEELVPKIIEHMKTTGEFGEFFPTTISPFGYNKSSAQMYYPLTKEQVLAKGLKWDDYEAPVADVKNTILAKDLPDNISEIKDDILNSAIECEETGRLFKITPQEFTFYKKQKIPLPKRSPNQRHLDRFHQRNPRRFWKRACGKCEKQIWTTFSPDRPEKVCCEECYLKAAY
ncbi:MAG: hypothetical protein Q8P62_02595 [Candidatus Peregrinibacteria bacterium]|nr:hypothetical protein [Candidatus Peregrinibacteria bacterium]